jgi:hypothetical protein
MKTTLTISLCLISLLSFGQIGKGAVSLSGTAGYSGSKDSGVPFVFGDGTVRPEFEYTRHTINIRPAIGYFITEKGQLVLQGIYEHKYANASFLNDQISNELGVLIGYQHFFSMSDPLLVQVFQRSWSAGMTCA